MAYETSHGNCIYTHARTHNLAANSYGISSKLI